MSRQPVKQFGNGQPDLRRSKKCFSAALQSREEVDELRDRLQEATFLAGFCGAINAPLDPEQVCCIAARWLYDYFHYQHFVVLLARGADEQVTAFSSREIKGGKQGYQLVERSLPGWRQKDLRGAADKGLAPRGRGATVTAPLILDLPAARGALAIYSGSITATASKEFLARVAELFAGALQNATEFGRFKELSLRDGLTGLFNRRFFEQVLELEAGKREISPLSLLLIDLDNFKRINDTHGHQGGDQVLAEVGRILRESCRGTDVVARYGGEEFAVLMPEATPTAALAMGERLRKTMAESLITCAGRQIELTISIGIAHRSADRPCSVEELVKRSDQSLYLAKNGGKNRVCCYAAGRKSIAGKRLLRLVGAI